MSNVISVPSSRNVVDLAVPECSRSRRRSAIDVIIANRRISEVDPFEHVGPEDVLPDARRGANVVDLASAVDLVVDQLYQRHHSEPPII